MGDIRLLRVDIQNFLSIKKVSIDFENRGLVGVLGPNGSGKSSLLVEPLTFSYFGQSERYGKHRDQIINRFVGKDCHVGSSLLIDNEILVEVDAYRKHSKFKDDVFLKIDGKDKRGNSNDYTWEKISKLLDMDYSTFTNSVVFGQALSQYFSGLTDSAQKEIIERLLGLTWIPDAYETSKKDFEGCFSLLTLAESECSSFKNNFEESKQELLEYKNKYEEFENQKKIRIEELKSSIKKIEGTKNLEEKIATVSESMEVTKISLNEFIAILKNLELEYNKLDSEVKRCEGDIKKIKSLIVKVSETEAGSICGFCGSTFFKEDVTKEWKAEYLSHLGKDANRVEKELLDPIDKKHKIHLELIASSEKKDGLENQIKKLELALKSEKGLLEKTTLENARIEERNSAAKEQIKEIKGSINIYEELLDKSSKKLQNLESSLKEAENKYIVLKSEVGYHRFWEEGFSNRGLKSLIIESMIPRMNQYAQLYSSMLGGKFNISFSPQKVLKKGEIREKFFVDVTNKFGSQCYEGNSNGERRAVDAIVLFVLGHLAASRSSKRFSTLILDDVFEKLDEEICDSIMRGLNMMVSTNEENIPKRENIFVLTHLEYFKDKFVNKILVSRDKQGFTTIES